MLTVVCRKPGHTPLTSRPVKSRIVRVFGQKVRALRTELGLSQEQLAEKAGVHRTYIGMIERAEKNITLENIAKLAKALNTPLHELMRLDGKK